MDGVVSIVEALSHRALPVAAPVVAMVGVIVLLRSPLARAVCWNVFLKAIGVPLDRRQSLLADAARADLGLPAGLDESRPTPRASTDLSRQKRRPHGLSRGRLRRRRAGRSPRTPPRRAGGR